MDRLEPIFGSVENDNAMAEAAASAAAGEIASREYFTVTSDSVHYTDQPQWVRAAIGKLGTPVAAPEALQDPPDPELA